MSKIISFLLLLNLVCINVFSIANKKENINPFNNLCKNKVAIIPIYNSSKKPEYDYLSITIVDVLRSELNKDMDNYYVFDPVVIDAKLKEKKLKNSLIWESEALSVGESLKANIVVYGYYVIENKIMTVNYFALDVDEKKTIVELKVPSNIGLDIIEQGGKISIEMAKQLSYKVKRKLNPINYTGVSFVVSGSILSAACIYMLAIASPLYFSYATSNSNTTNSSANIQVGNTLLALIISGAVIETIGLGLFIASFPLMIYKKKHSQLSLQININNSIEVAFNYRF